MLLQACGGADFAARALPPGLPREAGAPVRIALLLPLESEEEKWRSAAADMLAAAELALFDLQQPRLVLLVKNTAGAGQARRAAAEALAEEAELMIGPVLADNLAQVREEIAGQVPVIALSGNRAAGEGLFLLGFPPEQEITRILNYAIKEKIAPLAGLFPRTAYGRLARRVMVETARRQGAAILAIETYPPVLEEAIAPARRLADYPRRAARLEGLREKLQQAADWLGAPLQLRPARGRRMAEPFIRPAMMREAAEAELGAIREARTRGGLDYRGLFLPEGGDLLRGVAQLLPFFEISPQEVRLLGTGLWDDPALGRELPLVGGRFAAPPDGGEKLRRDLAALRGSDPARLASLAYDAVLLAGAAIAQTGGAPAEAFLRRAEGFRGTDGLFRFTAEGWPERGLAIVEIRRGGFVPVDAPTLPPTPSPAP